MGKEIEDKQNDSNVFLKDMHEACISPRTRNILLQNDINTRAKLLRRSNYDLYKLHNFGKKSLQECMLLIASISEPYCLAGALPEILRKAVLGYAKEVFVNETEEIIKQIDKHKINRYKEELNEYKQEIVKDLIKQLN